MTRDEIVRKVCEVGCTEERAQLFVDNVLKLAHALLPLFTETLSQGVLLLARRDADENIKFEYNMTVAAVTWCVAKLSMEAIESADMDIAEAFARHLYSSVVRVVPVMSGQSDPAQSEPQEVN